MLVVLPLQRIDGNMQPMRIIDIARHEQLVLYACTHNDRVRMRKELANTMPMAMAVQFGDMILQRQRTQNSN